MRLWTDPFNCEKRLDDQSMKLMAEISFYGLRKTLTRVIYKREGRRVKTHKQLGLETIVAS